MAGKSTPVSVSLWLWVVAALAVYLKQFAGLLPHILNALATW